MVVRVWEEGESECRPVIGRIRTEPNGVIAGTATLSGAKARPLPSGLFSRESLAN